MRLSPAQLSTENGLHAHHLPVGEAELFLRVTEPVSFKLVVIRKGAWKSPGAATLFDPAGKVINQLEFPRQNVIWQRQIVEVKARQRGVYRLAMQAPTVENSRSGSFTTWDVVTGQPLPAVMRVPENRFLEKVTPCLYLASSGDSATIEIDLAGEGEGFKKALLLDPDNHVAASHEAFIDLGDKGRYHYQLSAPIPPQHRRGLWTLSLQDVALIRQTGLTPYFSTSPQSFFRPDHQ